MRASESGRQRFETVAEFAGDVRDTLADHLAPAEVSFRGSLAGDAHDEYSDVDCWRRSTPRWTGISSPP